MIFPYSRWGLKRVVNSCGKVSSSVQEKVVLVSPSNLLAFLAAWDTWSRKLRASSVNTLRSFATWVTAAQHSPSYIHTFCCCVLDAKLHLSPSNSICHFSDHSTILWGQLAARHNPFPLGCLITPLCHWQRCVLCFGPCQGGRYL